MNLSTFHIKKSRSLRKCFMPNISEPACIRTNIQTIPSQRIYEWLEVRHLTSPWSQSSKSQWLDPAWQITSLNKSDSPVEILLQALLLWRCFLPSCLPAEKQYCTGKLFIDHLKYFSGLFIFACCKILEESFLSRWVRKIQRAKGKSITGNIYNMEGTWKTCIFLLFSYLLYWIIKSSLKHLA